MKYNLKITVLEGVGSKVWQVDRFISHIYGKWTDLKQEKFNLRFWPRFVVVQWRENIAVTHEGRVVDERALMACVKTSKWIRIRMSSRRSGNYLEPPLKSLASHWSHWALGLPELIIPYRIACLRVWAKLLLLSFFFFLVMFTDESLSGWRLWWGVVTVMVGSVCDNFYKLWIKELSCLT